MTREKPSSSEGGTSLAAILDSASSGTTRERPTLRCRQISRGTSKNTASTSQPYALAMPMYGARSCGVRLVASMQVSGSSRGDESQGKGTDVGC